DQVDKKFRGQKESVIVLAVLRPGKNQLKDYSLKRNYVYLSSLDAAYMTDAQTGYIKISKFAATTDIDFRTALRKLKADGMKKLVLDLRGNGGGYLNAATALADEFLSRDKLIVYTEGAHEPRTDYFATDSG